MKYIIAIYLIQCAALSYSQGNSDCLTAVSVCNPQYTELNSPSGTGQVFEMAPGTCQTGGEFNSAWYVFSPQNDGPLSFVLQPDIQSDDYDWSLFNITANGCAGINSGASPEISCNSYGEIGGVQGATGISTANGGAGNQNGPGNLNGPPFNGDINVTAGSVYALVIMNFSATLNGYTLNFGASQANIFDVIPPELIDVVIDCESSTVDLFFSESVDVQSCLPADFRLQLNGSTILTPINFTSASTTWGDHITLQFASILLEGTYTTLVDAINPATDVCGNPWSNSMSFTVLPIATLVVTTLPACNNTGGIADLVISNANDAVFTVTFNNVATSETHWEDLITGNYNLSVSNENGCMVNQVVTITNIALTVNAGVDQVLCDLNTSLTAVFNAGSIVWNSQPTLNFSSPTAATTNVISSLPGAQMINCTVTLGSCIATDSLSVTFANPPQITMTTTNATCYEGCDGTLVIQNINSSALNANVGGNAQTGVQITYSELCNGDHQAFVTHSLGCSSIYDFHIGSPPQVIASFESSAWIVKVLSPEVVLTNTSTNADSIHWQVLGSDSLFSFDAIWELRLPEAMGLYTIRLDAFNANQCSDHLEAIIEVRDEFRFYIPNSFTPNQDGVNDIFQVNFTYAPVRYELSIYNRFGDPIYQSKDYKEVWTGEAYNGTTFCPNGVYIWRLTVRGEEVKEETYSGHVSLMR